MQRIQRKRTAGFKLPENTKCVNRGTKWGNPYKIVPAGKQWELIKNKSIETFGFYPTKEDAAIKAV